jgi:fatty acid synthase subunit alpha, fungi type/fatty acid synthase subunit beta, fungi type
MQAIFPESVDGDFLKLVHLLNSSKILNSARPFRVGEKCRSAAKILAITSSLLRGRFSHYENTFQIVDELGFVVELHDASAVGVLQSKEWFDWDSDTMPLLPGTKLIFHVQTGVTYKNKTTYSSVNIAGKVYVRDQLKTLIPVATVDYTNGVSVGNPVTAHLQRHGVEQDQPVLFENAYTLTDANLPATFTAPATNEPYLQTSGDYNPIHINPYFSDYTSLPGTITYRMWSSAATRKYVETVVVQGKPERVIA